MNMMVAVAAYPETVDADMATRIRARLAEAQSLARQGDLEGARLACAQAVQDWLPWIYRDPELLQCTIAALLHARGFEQLRRLLAAVNGRRVRFVPMPQPEPAPQPEGIVASGTGDGTTVFRFADTLLDQPAGERLVSAWSRQLAAPLTSAAHA